MKNRQLISENYIIDEETGEEIRIRKHTLKPPKRICFPKNFIKIHGRAVTSMNNNELGYFVKLANHLDYYTNRLVDGHVGRTPKRLLHKDMADILDVSIRTVTAFMGKMSDIKSIIKIDSNYYINPSFASRSKGIDCDIVMEMKKFDPSIFQFIDDKQEAIINIFNLKP